MLLFFASFIVVFLLGIQQLNVEYRKYFASAITSVGLALSNYMLFKILPVGDFQFVQFLEYSLGGMLGVTLAMYAHDHFFPKHDKPKDTV
jgi:hypothetical protein